MTDYADLIARLRPVNQPVPLIYSEAADALEAQAREIERLGAEGFALAANACCVPNGVVGDDGGTPYCTLRSRLAAAERERDEAVALLRAIRDGVRTADLYNAGPDYSLPNRIDAFLAGAEAGK